jgi:hypothetical protein
MWTGCWIIKRGGRRGLQYCVRGCGGNKGEKRKFGPYVQPLPHISHCMGNLRLGFLHKICNKNIENHVSSSRKYVFHSSNRIEKFKQFLQTSMIFFCAQGLWKLTHEKSYYRHWQLDPVIPSTSQNLLASDASRMWRILLTWLALLDPHTQTTWWGSREGLWSWISTGIEMNLPSAISQTLNLSILQHESGNKIQDTSFSIIYNGKHI